MYCGGTFSTGGRCEHAGATVWQPEITNGYLVITKYVLCTHHAVHDMKKTDPTSQLQCRPFRFGRESKQSLTAFSGPAQHNPQLGFDSHSSTLRALFCTSPDLAPRSTADRRIPSHGMPD